MRRLTDDRAHLGIQLCMPFLICSRRARSASFGMIASAGIADEHGHRDRHAALAGRAVSRADQRVDCLFEIGIRHHHHVILGAAERLHALAGCRARAA